MYKINITDDFRVEQLENFQDEYVYDFEMDTTNEEEQVYFANDILVHNSVYFSIHPILQKMGIKLLNEYLSVSEEANKVIDDLDVYLNEGINELAKQQLFTLDPRYVFKREVISDAGTFLMKKNYVLHVVDDEGKKVSKYKYVGVKVAKSTVSKQVKHGLKKVMETLLTTKNEKKTNAVYKEVYEEFKSLTIDDMAERTAVHNLEEYAEKASLHKFESGTPYHVKASIAYNILLKELDVEDKYERIVSDQKIKLFYLKKNPYNLDAIAYASEYPKEFAVLKIDIDKMFYKL